MNNGVLQTDYSSHGEFIPESEINGYDTNNDEVTEYQSNFEISK